MAAILALVACATPASPPVSPVALTAADFARWSVVEQTDDSLVIRDRHGADGLRIQLRADDAWTAPGVSLIIGGRTTGIRAGDRRTPLVTPDWGGAPVLAVTVEEDGPDVVVRFTGAGIATVSDHPDAPDDPLLTWVRVRPSADGWRVGVVGLAAVSGPGDVTATLLDELALRVEGPHAQLDFDIDATAVSSSLSGLEWRLSTWPSLAANEPYPKLGFRYHQRN